MSATRRRNSPGSSRRPARSSRRSNSTTSTDLSNQGFTVTGQGDAPNFAYTSSVIEYSSAADLPAVNTLKGQIQGPVEVQQDTAVTAGPLSLILGSTFNGIKTQQPSVSSLAQSYGGIAGNANICSDSAAFSGPDTPLPGG